MNNRINNLVLIGVSEYDCPEWKDLSNVSIDLERTKKVLTTKYGFEVLAELTSKEETTSTNIKNALFRLSRTIGKEDNLIIYHAGHGAFLDQVGYWIGSDSTRDKGVGNYINHGTILEYIQKIDCQHILFITDSCYSGMFILPSRGNELSNYSQLKKTNQSLYYKTLDKKKSRFMLTSGAREVVPDGKKGEGSIFNRALCSILELNEDKYMSITSLGFQSQDFTGLHGHQNPQFSHIQGTEFEGGSLILSNNQIDSLIQKDENIKFIGHKDFKTILKLFRRNSTFHPVIENYKDLSNKVGIQLYLEEDLTNRKTYFLYLYQRISQKNTVKYLEENTNIYSTPNSSIVVFLSKEAAQKDFEVKVHNIKQKFKATAVLYIDDFIRDKCTNNNYINNQNNSQYLDVTHFIVPSLKKRNGESIKDIKKTLFDWLDKKQRSLFIIKGVGGVGKTTFANYIADCVLRKIPKKFVFFIDSIKIKDILIRNMSFGDTIDIYDFYKAFCDEISSEKMSRDEFRLNLDAGNILLIIDGLDEVISKVPNFDVEAFLLSIDKASNVLEGGKVIITCRNYFWEQTEIDISNKLEVEIAPFTTQKANEFFSKNFNNEKKLIAKGFELAETFKLAGKHIRSESTYHPYLLDIICLILKDNDNSIVQYDMDIESSQYLKINNSNDYIILKVCNREERRVGQVGVNDQILFFIYLANEKDGLCLDKLLPSILKEALDKEIDLVRIEAFKAHPFIKATDNVIKFRYDFLAETFKSIYVTSYFDFDSSNDILTDGFIKTIINSCSFDAPINKDIISRIDKWTDVDRMFISDLIEQSRKKESFPEKKLHQFIANLFNLCLNITHSQSANTKRINTNLLKEIFEQENGEIWNMCIMNIKTKLTFDFSKLTLNHCYIDNYEDFSNCTFSQTTFKNSKILNLTNTKNNSFKGVNFQNCTIDRVSELVIKTSSSDEKNKRKLAKNFISIFFELFSDDGRYHIERKESTLKAKVLKHSKGKLTFKQVQKVLKKTQILSLKSGRVGKKYEIDPDLRESISRFVKDDLPSPNIVNAIKELSTFF